MVSAQTGRILPFARPDRRARATRPPLGGRSDPRATTRRMPTGALKTTVTFDLPDLRPQRPARECPKRDAASSDQRASEDTSRAHDPTALDVLPHLYGRDPHRPARFARDVQTQVQFLLRGRAGAIVSTVVGRRGRDAPALQSLGDLHTYRTIMGAWTWACLFQAVRETRSYEAGLDAGLLLLRVAERHHARLSRREFAAHRQQLYWFILEMLDRLDRWEAYLATWVRVRARTGYADRVGLEARQLYGAQLTPYVLREDARGLTVHFLWMTRYRKGVIERKAGRQRRGQKLGNAWHATQDELSDAELRERVAWVACQARAASWQGSP